MRPFASKMKSSKPSKHRVTPGVFIAEELCDNDPRIRTSEAERARALEIEIWPAEEKVKLHLRKMSRIKPT